MNLTCNKCCNNNKRVFPTSAHNLALSAFAAARRAAARLLLSAGQQSIDISCSPGPQQQTRGSGERQVNGTDRRTDTVYRTTRAVPIIITSETTERSLRLHTSSCFMSFVTVLVSSWIGQMSVSLTDPFHHPPFLAAASRQASCELKLNDDAAISCVSSLPQ